MCCAKNLPSWAQSALQERRIEFMGNDIKDNRPQFFTVTLQEAQRKVQLERKQQRNEAKWTARGFAP